MNQAEANVVLNSIQANPTIQIVNLSNRSIVYHNVDDFIQELKKQKIPQSKTFELSFEEGEDLAHPVMFIHINDKRIPRYFIQIIFERPVPHFDKLAEYIRKNKLYWLIAYIQIFQINVGPVRTEGRIEQFFRRMYVEWCEGNSSSSPPPPPSDSSSSASMHN